MRATSSSKTTVRSFCSASTCRSVINAAKPTKAFAARPVSGEATPRSSASSASAVVMLVLPRPLAELLQRLLADAAPRHVDDALEADRLVRVVDHAQIGDQIAHFAPLVEADAADQLIADAVLDEGFFKRARLGVGAVHHGEIAVAVALALASAA